MKKFLISCLLLSSLCCKGETIPDVDSLVDGPCYPIGDQSEDN